MLSLKDLNSIKTLYDFDNIYTAKAHGFKDGADYYKQCSCLQFLPDIKIPALVINALNDSFLSSDCYPVKEAKQNSNLFLEMPKHGGHVGFVDKKNIYYNENYFDTSNSFNIPKKANIKLVSGPAMTTAIFL